MKKGLLVLALMSISACSTLEFAPIDINIEPEADEGVVDSRADPMADNNERIIDEARQDGRLERK
ncbi:hypothetical protein [uncultured Shewanella sp.]|uniref:hypothetical protein n=1 Tax=Shewanella atlantica TaxID=271099 RepID=UPI00262992B0|nr:hypothetical protein [uncultured Shewanella sp.]